MKSKIFCFILLIIVIVLAVALVYYKNQNNQPVIENTNKTPEASNNLDVSITPFSQTDSFYNIHADYPQFKNASSAFNSRISSLISGKINAFEKEAKDNWDARKATASPGEVVPDNPPTPFDFIMTWTPSQMNTNYISFVVDIYYFTGGAHGIEEMYAFNYDVAGKRDITISDFLGNSETALQKLSTMAAEDVTNQLKSSGMKIDSNVSSMIQEGTKPTAENYQNFTFTYNSLNIYFQQYQVAPGSAGTIKSTFYKQVLDQNSINTSYLK